ncbi:SAM-dependent methyltransferase [Nibricoccus aquaticus]|uniref:tRNA (guanine-N(7)-)-methyltransferase n=1 Tax=Nibricoccus aquaticus TaxID=2576891 RepID=A0A290QJG7_9BACT|nr:SAM-dependent methyltransferase [Nibricoccus aquaticus]ATC64022.1 SAM-dependent methyltransferase [Nibricoccus aquaticus]
MDNAARTADYLSRRDSRLSALKTFLADSVPAKALSQLTFEIGCGHGHYLTAYAAAHPDAFCIGIDLLKDRIIRAGRKRDRAKLTNLLFLEAEAREFLDALPSLAALADIFILFSDPWPKRRHHKNRILQSDFLSALAAKTRPGARLCFRTDYAPYFSAAQATVASHSDWKVDASDSWPFELETVFQSRAASYQSLVARRASHLAT